MTSKNAQKVKAALRSGNLVYSAWLTFNSPTVAELIAATGFDVLLVDMEHTSMSLADLEFAVAAVSRWDPVVIVRVPDHGMGLIKRVLDIGVDGIMAPMVMNAEQAGQVVAAVKYPPMGKRGYGPRRASGYFRDETYFNRANENTFVMMQIEHPKAAARADEIAATEGLDVLCLGPADLAANMGLLHDQSHSDVQAAIDQVFAAADKFGLPVCMGRYETAEDQVGLVGKGARFVIASDDLVVLRSGLDRHLAEARAVLNGRSAAQKRDMSY